MTKAPQNGIPKVLPARQMLMEKELTVKMILFLLRGMITLPKKQATPRIRVSASRLLITTEANPHTVTSCSLFLMKLRRVTSLTTQSAFMPVALCGMVISFTLSIQIMVYVSENKSIRFNSVKWIRITKLLLQRLEELNYF